LKRVGGKFISPLTRFKLEISVLLFSLSPSVRAGRFTEKVSVDFNSDDYFDCCYSSGSHLVPDAFPHRVSTIIGSCVDQRHDFGRCPLQLASGLLPHLRLRVFV
jgi:hypothetical protein